VGGGKSVFQYHIYEHHPRVAQEVKADIADAIDVNTVVTLIRVCRNTVKITHVSYIFRNKRGVYSGCFVNTCLCVRFWERKKNIYIFFLWGCRQVGYSVQTSWPSSHSTSDLGNIIAQKCKWCREASET
jgi:hypothetical protein